MTNAERIELLYRGLQKAHGTFAIIGPDKAKKGKIAGKAITLHETPTVIKWQLHLDGKQGIGIITINEMNKCRWGVGDVDVYEKGLLEKIEKKVNELKIPVLCLRTKSGGVHVVAFLKEDVDARIVRAKMTEIMNALGYPNIEIYPKQISLANKEDVGNWLNMPYFDDAAVEKWIKRTPEADEEAEAERQKENVYRYAIKDGKPLSLDEFLNYAESMKLATDEFIAINVSGDEAFADGPPCLQTMARNGIGTGIRNDAMFGVTVYLKQKYPDEWKTKLIEMNNTHVTPPLGHGEIRTLTLTNSRKDYFYKCTTSPCKDFCQKELCKTRLYGIGDGRTTPAVEIGNFKKICTDPPVWRVTVNEIEFELSVEQLMNQHLFAMRCGELINFIPPPMKPGAWITFLNKRLIDAEMIEAPPEASIDGQFIVRTAQFCMRNVAKEKDELLLSRVYTNDGRHYFKSQDLMDYLKQQHFNGVDAKKAWTILHSKREAKNHKFTLKGEKVECWSITEFKRQDKDFDAVKIKETF